MAISTNDHEPAVSNFTYGLMKDAVGPCIALVTECQTDVLACLSAVEVCNVGLLIPYTLTGMNPYDMREKCADPPLCYDFSNVGKFLAKPDVIATLGVEGHSWSDCNRAVTIFFELSGDWMKDYQNMIPDQLAAGIRVMMYAGDQDYICNWLGNQAWTQELEWPGHDAFNAASAKPWMVNGTEAGTLQTADGFSFLRVYDAGHMVPRDQPAVALAMLNAFITGKI